MNKVLILIEHDKENYTRAMELVQDGEQIEVDFHFSDIDDELESGTLERKGEDIIIHVKTLWMGDTKNKIEPTGELTVWH